MLGAIIGDIIGSPYEFGSDKTKDFLLFAPESRPTDDSIITIAVGCACAEAELWDENNFKQLLCEYIREIGLRYPDAGYGDRFYQWMIMDEDEPYGGYTNGSAMRVSPTAWAADTLPEVEELAKWSAEITHDHPEGIKGAQAVAAAIFLARTGADKAEIREYIEENYYDLNFTTDEIRPTYSHDMTCEGSVPQAIVAFLDSEDFEDAIRNAVSLGGDGDTIACIAGAIAEAFYGIPEDLQEEAFEYIDEDLQEYYWSYADTLYR
ncbi:MAG: ADP-ribosylglycohydrolase family protein [Clostridia bacterium]|nr:ADP-ribosylglycohydrolase family protein [Clostridia bacterium]